MGSQEVAYTRIEELIERTEEAEAAATRQVGNRLDRLAYLVEQEQLLHDSGQGYRISGDGIAQEARDLVRWIGEAKAARNRVAELRSLLA